LRVSFDRVVRLKSSNRRIIGGVIPFEEWLNYLSN
jgi:hypothetical protein